MQPKSDLIRDEKLWDHVSHDKRFFRTGRSTHLVQGLGGMWYAGSDVVVNFHEESFVSGLVIAHRLGAGYLFKDHALAKAVFLRFRGWMLYGLNPLLPFSIERGDGNN